jgi:hypothetical protein
MLLFFHWTSCRREVDGIWIRSQNKPPPESQLGNFQGENTQNMQQCYIDSEFATWNPFTGH